MRVPQGRTRSKNTFQQPDLNSGPFDSSLSDQHGPIRNRQLFPEFSVTSSGFTWYHLVSFRVAPLS